MRCPVCGAEMVKNGFTAAETQKYLCSACGKQTTDKPKKPGPKPLGGEPMTGTERSRKSRGKGMDGTGQSE
jgi:transcription initiation factor TFIIIB Brf1 subunit/transcription initiation factor TFIIB